MDPGLTNRTPINDDVVGGMLRLWIEPLRLSPSAASQKRRLRHLQAARYVDDIFAWIFHGYL
jgi:hypothetical protein